MTGCLNHTPGGLCLGGGFPCYAYKLANGRLRSRYLANPNIIGNDQWKCAHTPTELNIRLNDPFYPRFWEDRLAAPLRLKRPRGIFVCDMSDLFGIGIPENWTYEVIQTIKQAPFMGLRHRFYLLTKQPQNLIKFSPFPPTCYVGVTVCNADMLFDAINHLDEIQCSVRYLSIEPMLASCFLVDLDAHLAGSVDWLIIGACTGNHFDMWDLCQRYPGLTLMQWGKRWTLQPKIEWVEEIVRAADKASVPVFLKDNLKPLIFNTVNGVDTVESHNLWACKYFKLRQELPRAE